MGSDPYQIASVCRTLGISKAELAAAVGASAGLVRRLERDPGEAEALPETAVRLREVGRLMRIAHHVLDGSTPRWMRTPNRGLFGDAPLDVLVGGDIQTVICLLEMVNDGGFC